MDELVDAIFFDVGGTLRRGTSREFSEKVILCKQILNLTGLRTDPVEFTLMLDTRANAYRKWSRSELVELNEIRFWTQWMLPELASEKVGALAVDLNRIWRNADRDYQVFPDTKETMLSLFRRGYRLGIISNTTSSIEAPDLLDELELSGCFETIVLSCQVGIRKPRPEIFLEATNRMGIEPELCAYIGNLPDRDVASACAAGFKKTVILCDPHKPFEPPVDPALVPNHYIYNLIELLDLFPARSMTKSKPPEINAPVYDASLSTMWARKNFSALGDFLLAAHNLGFQKTELNHQVTSEMLASINPGTNEISSVHEPCPADISVETLKTRDWMISSPDEDCRQQGIAALKRTIELADTLSVQTVVMHAGHVSLDMVLEKKLRNLFDKGLTGSAEYQEIKNLMINERSKLIGPCWEAVEKSLKELLDFAGRHRIQLGLENRYHYFDIPTQDEMSLLLSLAESDRLGFIYDSGHASVMDCLGFFPNEIWLKRYGGRIIGTHLHDVIGISDHYAPGLGEVDFHMIATFLPKEAFRTIEARSVNTPEQVKAGLKKLVDMGCVNVFDKGE